MIRAARTSISRRTVLRGAGGVALGLPALEAIRVRVARAATGVPRRLVVVYSPNGHNMDGWKCQVSAADPASFTFSPGTKPLGLPSPGCEDLDVCTGSKFVCVAEAGGTASNKLGQTYAEITSALSSAMQSYDDLNLTQWNFAPIAPLVKCQ